jgi:hypothetical protein
VMVHDYRTAIRTVVKRALSDGFGMALVPGGLRLMAISSGLAKGDYLGAIAHALYHSRNPGLPCLLSNNDAAAEETRQMGAMPPLINMLYQNLHSQYGVPVFMWLEPELVMDIVMGRVILFAQLDVAELMSLAASEGIKMSWLVKNCPEEFKRFTETIPGSPNAWGVRAETLDGMVRPLLAGMFARVICYLTSPRELIRMIKEFPIRHPEFKDEYESPVP